MKKKRKKIESLGNIALEWIGAHDMAWKDFKIYVKHYYGERLYKKLLRIERMEGG